MNAPFGENLQNIHAEAVKNAKEQFDRLSHFGVS